MVQYKLYAYEDFGYLTGPLPRRINNVYGEILTRARALLGHRSEYQIGGALESLDWMLRRSTLLEKALAEDKPDGSIINRVKALRAYREDIELTDQPTLPNATWAEYFAVLALAYVAEAVFIENHSHIDATSRDHDPTSNDAFLWNQALEAMDAIAYAEGLHTLEKTLEALEAERTTIASEVMRLHGGKGGRIRAAKFSALKQKVIDRYNEDYSNRSVRLAAKKIYEELKGEINVTLSTDEPTKTLEKWIGQYKKSIQAPD